jgi:glucokinase
MAGDLAVGVDFGGTKLLAAVASDEELTGSALRRPTPVRAPVETLCAMLDEVRGGSPLEGIALAVPGPFDRGSGALIEPPNIASAWHHLPIAEELGRRYGCRVVLENDANCAALAEARRGAAAGFERVVYFTVSTGCGTGIVAGGRPVVGRHDTEGGHQVLWPEWLGGPPCRCGGHGCLETLVSGPSIERRFGVRGEHLTDDAACLAGLGFRRLRRFLQVFHGSCLSMRWNFCTRCPVCTSAV